MSAEQVFDNLYALFDIYRKFGFSADEIYFVPEAQTPLGEQVVGMAVQRKGRIYLATIDREPPEVYEEVRRGYEAFAQGLHQRSQEELTAMWDRSAMKWQTGAIAHGLVTKGLL